MIPAGGLWGALLLLATQPLPPPGDGPKAAITQFQFAPPVGPSMTYRVTTRRIGRDGSLINFSLLYALQWQRIGRGYQLKAVLQRIDTDASAQVKRALTLMLDPLVGEDVAYLVAPDGSRIDLIDPDGLWERVIARIEATGKEAERPEARQLVGLIAALPATERDQLVTADVRALIAPANHAIPVHPQTGGASVSIHHDGTRQTFAKVERASAAVGATARPLEIDNLWTVDVATGLVMREQRQSWMVEADGEGRTLVEERVRTLELTP